MDSTDRMISPSSRAAIRCITNSLTSHSHCTADTREWPALVWCSWTMSSAASSPSTSRPPTEMYVVVLLLWCNENAKTCSYCPYIVYGCWRCAYIVKSVLCSQLVASFNKTPIAIFTHSLSLAHHATFQEDAGANMSEKVDQMMQQGVNRLVVNMNTLRSYFTNANPRSVSVYCVWLLLCRV